MATDLSIHDYDLPTIEDYLAGDSRTLAFEVVNADGDAVDITDADVTWALYARAYQDSDPLLDGDDGGVEIVTDDRVDTEAGEFEVRLDPEATEDHWGSFWHRPEVEQANGSTASWRGKLVLTA